MTNLARYRAADLPALMEKINKYGIGLDSYFDQFFSYNENSNYPPYNLIHLSNHESRLEVALAGFAKEEVNVYTEYGKLHIEGTKSDPDEEETFIHRGLAKRTFKRSWTIAEDTHVTDVAFDNGLLVVKLGKIVPEHHARKDYLT